MKCGKWMAVSGGLTLVAVVGVTSLHADGRRGAPRPEEVTLIGQLVDLQTYMTEKCSGEDFARCTRDNIRAGVPAALVSDDGLIVIGTSDKGPARLLLPLAYQEVEMNGMLYDKDGLLYIDMASVKVYKEEGEEEQPVEGREGGVRPIPQPHPQPEPQPEQP